MNPALSKGEVHEGGRHFCHSENARMQRDKRLKTVAKIICMRASQTEAELQVCVMEPSRKHLHPDD